MHQKFEDDYDWVVVDQPSWISRLASELAILELSGLTNKFHIQRALKVIGMLEIDQIIGPIPVNKKGPVRIFWPRGNCEKLEVTFDEGYSCYVRIKSMHKVIHEGRCGLLGLRSMLLEFYPYVKSNFDRSFT